MKACVAIGVNRVEFAATLPTLAGAASGAEAFGEWARAEGFDAYVITDAAQPVTVKSVRDCIAAIVQSRTCTQLVIYFAGHGILKAADTEMWLLSEAATDANAAVNVVNSIRLGRKCAIPHLVFVSDACRALAADQRLSEVTGSVIFPTEDTSRIRPEVDTFYATLPGDVALEVPAQDAAKNYDGIFTKCMLVGLTTPESRLIETVSTEDGVDMRVVSSRTLKPWLETKVPADISKLNLEITQIPEVRVESQRPKHLAIVTQPPPPIVPSQPFQSPEKPNAAPDARTAQLPDVTSPSEQVVRKSDAMRSSIERVVDPDIDRPRTRRPISPRRFLTEIGNSLDSTRLKEFAEEAKAILAEQVVASSEGNTGFSLRGTDEVLVEFDGKKMDSGDILLQGKQWRLNVQPTTASRSALIRFGEDSGTCLATMPGYVGTVVVEAGRVASVNYTPSENGDLFADFAQHREEIIERRAMATAAARRGYFRVATRNAKKFAAILRKFKHLDPTLGIYSAYAYAQSGMMEEVDSVFELMAKQQVIPFDVALLAGKLDRVQLITGRIAPFCPMLTQGWSLLDESLPVRPAVLTAARYLKPALWTTLTEKGVQLLSSPS